MKRLFDDPGFYDPRVLFGREECEGYGTAPKYEGSGEIKVVENYDEAKSYYIKAYGATRADREAYALKLLSAGFELYYSTETNGNKFSIYTDGYNVVNLSDVTYADPFKKDNIVSYLCIAIESLDYTELPPLGVKTEKVTETEMIMIGTQALFIIRLEDGRFIIVDGGVENSPCGSNIEYIYQWLTEKNVLGGKPVIAAWIITHAHADHIAGTLRFGQKYSSEVVLERMIFNFPGNGRLEEVIDDPPHNYRWINNMYNIAVNGCFSSAKTVVAHVGQKFEFGSCGIEILWTHEHLNDRTMVWGNLMSTIFKVYTPAGDVIFIGDQCHEACKLALAICPDWIKADFVQYGHHSFYSGSHTFFTHTGAKYAIWTNSYENIAKACNYGMPGYNAVYPNNGIISICPTMKEMDINLRPDMTKADLAKYIRWEYDVADFYDPQEIFGLEDKEMCEYDNEIDMLFDGDEDAYYKTISDSQVYHKYGKTIPYFAKALFGKECCKGYGTAPRYDGAGEISFSEKTDKVYTLEVRGASAADYESYLSKTERLGFLLHHTEENGDAVYTDGYNILTVSYAEDLLSVAIDCVCGKKFHFWG